MKVHKQTTCEGCLPVCLLSFTKEKVNIESELSLLTGGFRRNRESYALGILDEFTLKFKTNIVVYIDNRKFFNKASRLVNNSRIKLKQIKIDKKFLEKIEKPFILSLDSFSLHKDVHWPHYVIAEASNDSYFFVIDPWGGKRVKIKKAGLIKGVSSLRNHLKFCPLAIELD